MTNQDLATALADTNINADNAIKQLVLARQFARYRRGAVPNRMALVAAEVALEEVGNDVASSVFRVALESLANVGGGGIWA